MCITFYFHCKVTPIMSPVNGVEKDDNKKISLKLKNITSKYPNFHITEMTPLKLKSLINIIKSLMPRFLQSNFLKRNLFSKKKNFTLMSS